MGWVGTGWDETAWNGMGWGGVRMACNGTGWGSNGMGPRRNEMEERIHGTRNGMGPRTYLYAEVAHAGERPLGLFDRAVARGRAEARGLLPLA